MSVDLFAVIISSVSLIVSAITLHLSYFKPANIKMIASRAITIANSYIDTTDSTNPTRVTRKWGGVSFILPFTFSNWSSKGGTIYKMRLVITTPTGNTNYDILWSSFIQFTDGGANWESVSVAYPFSIQSKSSVTKFIRFDWSPDKSDKIDIQQGQYSLSFYTWTNDKPKPNLQEKTTFILLQEQADDYAQSEPLNTVIPLEVLLGDESRISANDTKTNAVIKQMYG